MTMQLAPVPTETATCANCSAPLVADQRYCLTCGQPVSPVRLAFLDVLQGEGQGQPAGRALATTPVAYAPLIEPTAGATGWLRRYSPLFGALTVMLLAVIAGLLVGHWVTQRNAPVAAAPTSQTIKIEGLGGLAAAAATTPSSTSAAPSTATSKTTAKEESEEAANEEKTEAAQAKKAETAPVIKQSSGSVKKLNKTTGKKHEEEINSLGAQPIETG